MGADTQQSTGGLDVQSMGEYKDLDGVLDSALNNNNP